MKTRIMQIAVMVAMAAVVALGIWKPDKAEAATTPLVTTLSLFTNQIAPGTGGATSGGATNTNSHVPISVSGAYGGMPATLTLVYSVTNNGTSNIVAGINTTADGINWSTAPYQLWTNPAVGSNGPVVAIIPLTNLPAGTTAVSLDYFNTLQTNAIGVSGTVTYQRQY